MYEDFCRSLYYFKKSFLHCIFLLTTFLNLNYSILFSLSITWNYVIGTSKGYIYNLYLQFTCNTLYNTLHVIYEHPFSKQLHFRYTMSVQWDHVVPGFPYISETGTLSPESCIFAQFLNIAALLRKYQLVLRLNVYLPRLITLHMYFSRLLRIH